jgi:hypothetical protein
MSEVLELYEAKCADAGVDYMAIQAKFFVDKFTKYSANCRINMQE